MKRRVLLVTLSLFAAMAILFTACSSPAPAPAPAPTTAPAPAPAPTTAPKPSPTTAPAPAPAPTTAPAAWKPPANVSLGNGSSASTGYVSGAAMLPAMEQASGVKFNIVPGAKTSDRAKMLLDGTVSFSWHNGLDLLTGLQGVDDYAQWGPQSYREAYVLGNLDQGIATRADSGIKTWQDLRGKKVATYPTYPIMQTYMDAALAFGGLKWSDVIETPVSSFASGQTSIGEGATDAAAMSGTSAEAQDLAASYHGIYWIPMPASDIEGWKQFQAIIPCFYPMKSTLSAGASAANPVEIWAYNYNAVAYDWTDQNLTYWFTKLLVDTFPKWKDTHAFNKGSSPEHALDYKNWFCPWAEGSIQYWKDVGKWTPAMEAKQQELLKEWPQRMTKPKV